MTNVAVQVVVPAAAALMLFALGLTIDVAQLGRLLQRPRALLVGLASRWALVPGLAVLLCLVDRPSPPIALGLLLVASCPTATPAPALVRAGAGDTALGIALTATTNLASVVMLPLLLSLGSLLVGIEGRVDPSSLARVVFRIGALVIAPTVLGMVLRRARPVLARRMEPKVTPVALALLVPIIVLVLVSSREVVIPSLVQSGALAVELNLLALLGASLIARLAGLTPGEALAVLAGSGLFNFGLGVFVSLSVLREPRILVPGIAYGALMWLTAAAVTAWTRRIVGRRHPDQVAAGVVGRRSSVR
ncbi:MAG TPA: bile acid:sodium symporter [Myxococcaceae bacterium]|nr:bile acid:sodium symporter [Myxococcaceae bacterium]